MPFMNTARWAGMSRRTVLGAGVGVAVGAAAGAGGVVMAGHSAQSSPGVVEFRGSHQAGIATAAQDRLHFAAFDVITEDKTELIALLRAWTAAAERMTRGLETEPEGAVGQGAYLPPSDTGEALNLSPSRLTLTIGFGPSLFGPDASDPTRSDRFGLATRRPAALTPLPAFVGDQLDPARCGGDICIQACSDDPQVAVHAVRNLARMGFGVVSVRWSQLGFGRTSSTSAAQETPRNMFGFKDGTANIKSEDTATSDRWVWVANSDNNDPEQRNSAAWMTGGSYLVARRIRMRIETWDRASLSEQELVIGRSKGTGAPLGQAAEFDRPDFNITNGSAPVIARTAHVRLAHPDNLDGVQILRRGYNFTDGSDGFGHLDAGLFFIAYCRDPRSQFVPMQRALAAKDAMNEYITHNGSALFACPPGLSTDEWWGQRLFED
ncbi:iron uptake transporter deferrochelatase/peroxidase subunit [Gordonia polyisoprenivorans]|uniref:Deferrochelatase n=1 Tax=Gordonia polyisoprenivorans TaxID=84595 RepID=A0A846WJF3_9ACTN|nr:iron uptake transporter deferrochelatase/peroxidase subunit [Gordonia polyisoprenivorans]NKY01832.1 deferrochelatase/peroxidase EfeB [Gordonia polyisoprenivorans]WCB36906.1 iron uptake transporter deferrochelatase/peroxidase subunit [Gordonia polyisoprenivorans]